VGKLDARNGMPLHNPWYAEESLGHETAKTACSTDEYTGEWIHHRDRVFESRKFYWVELR
jgi:hypothetical protein